MTHPNKVKGNGFEREVVEQAKAVGLDAQRAWGSNGQSIGHHDTVDVVIADQRFQLKRKKSLPKWIGLTEHVDGAILREDRGKALAIIPLARYLELLKHATSQQ